MTAKKNQRKNSKQEESSKQKENSGPPSYIQTALAHVDMTPKVEQVVTMAPKDQQKLAEPVMATKPQIDQPKVALEPYTVAEDTTNRPKYVKAALTKIGSDQPLDVELPMANGDATLTVDVTMDQKMQSPPSYIQAALARANGDLALALKMEQVAREAPSLAEQQKIRPIVKVTETKLELEHPKVVFDPYDPNSDTSSRPAWVKTALARLGGGGELNAATDAQRSEFLEVGVVNGGQSLGDHFASPPSYIQAALAKASGDLALKVEKSLGDAPRVSEAQKVPATARVTVKEPEAERAKVVFDPYDPKSDTSDRPSWFKTALGLLGLGGELNSTADSHRSDLREVEVTVNDSESHWEHISSPPAYITAALARASGDLALALQVEQVARETSRVSERQKVQPSAKVTEKKPEAEQRKVVFDSYEAKSDTSDRPAWVKSALARLGLGGELTAATDAQRSETREVEALGNGRESLGEQSSSPPAYIQAAVAKASGDLALALNVEQSAKDARRVSEAQKIQQIAKVTIKKPEAEQAKVVFDSYDAKLDTSNRPAWVKAALARLGVGEELSAATDAQPSKMREVEATANGSGSQCEHSSSPPNYIQAALARASCDSAVKVEPSARDAPRVSEQQKIQPIAKATMTRADAEKAKVVFDPYDPKNDMTNRPGWFKAALARLGVVGEFGGVVDAQPSVETTKDIATTRPAFIDAALAKVESFVAPCVKADVKADVVMSKTKVTLKTPPPVGAADAAKQPNQPQMEPIDEATFGKPLYDGSVRPTYVQAALVKAGPVLPKLLGQNKSQDEKSNTQIVNSDLLNLLALLGQVEMGGNIAKLVFSFFMISLARKLSGKRMPKWSIIPFLAMLGVIFFSSNRNKRLLGRLADRVAFEIWGA